MRVDESYFCLRDSKMLKGNLDPVVGIVFNGNKQALLFQN
jgi:hypothetical protein